MIIWLTPPPPSTLAPLLAAVPPSALGPTVCPETDVIAEVFRETNHGGPILNGDPATGEVVLVKGLGGWRRRRSLQENLSEAQAHATYHYVIKLVTEFKGYWWLEPVENFRFCKFLHPRCCYRGPPSANFRARVID